MSAQASKARLAGLLKQLVGSWEETQSSWADDKAREFHDRHMVELMAQVEKTLTSLDQLEVIIQKMKDDCE